ncbi:MAG: thioredoxin domain-containing protein [Verrucomicrobia bacterium]|nr:thioredoxin domain-containing protein [Verrucomicrobiota bacterium]
MIHRIPRTVFTLVALVAVSALSWAAAAPAKGEKPLRVAQGEKVNLADYLIPGKTTVFDFTSEYCPPCKAIAPSLEKLHAKRADVVVVAVDINRPGVRGIDWKSPVAQQYGLHSIPHFKVYGPDGKMIAEDKQGDAKARAMVTKWFD